jgi:hypothetical protein
LSAPAGSRARRAAAVIVLLAALVSGCAAKRFLGFGGDATLLVRHHESEPQEIRIDGDVLGVADSGIVACFRDVRTGTLRLEARAPGNVLTRATSIVLPPDQARLWDIDHDQILEGRAFAGLCD